MLDKISKVLFFIFVIITTYIVISFAEVSKIESFIEDQKGLISSSGEYYDYELIQTTSLTYTNKKYEAYIYKEPLFKEHFEYKDNSDKLIYEFDLVFYKYIESYKKVNNSSLAIIINNLVINDEQIFLSDRENPVIDLDIEYDQPFIYSNHEYSKSIERFQPFEGLNSYILLINYGVLKNNDGFVNFKNMNFKYRVLGDDTTYKPLLSLYNEDFYNDEEPFDIEDSISSDINRSLKTIHSSNVVFTDSDLNALKLTSDFYHNVNNSKALSKKNFYYFKYLGIELSIVLVVTYFLFLHKDVMILVRNKKMNKQKEIELLKQKLKEDEEN